MLSGTEIPSECGHPQAGAEMSHCFGTVRSSCFSYEILFTNLKISIQCHPIHTSSLGHGTKLMIRIDACMSLRPAKVDGFLSPII